MEVSPRLSHRTREAARWELAVVLILPLLLISPLLRPGLPGLADAHIHLLRAVEWDYLWRNGLFLPTWAPNLAFGYGYPLFNFAPPLPYILIDMWHLLGFSFETAVKLLSIAILYLSCCGAFLFARRTLDFGPALLVAAAQIYTPFVFHQHLLYGGNYPQLLGMALFPWGLWALHRLLKRQKKFDFWQKSNFLGCHLDGADRRGRLIVPRITGVSSDWVVDQLYDLLSNQTPFRASNALCGWRPAAGCGSGRLFPAACFHRTPLDLDAKHLLHAKKPHRLELFESFGLMGVACPAGSECSESVSSL